MKDELGEKITTEFVSLRPKAYIVIQQMAIMKKKGKGTKKCVIKRKIKFECC